MHLLPKNWTLADLARLRRWLPAIDCWTSINQNSNCHRQNTLFVLEAGSPRWLSLPLTCGGAVQDPT